MSDLIRLLPDSVANQIAAGEVIQRPASAVKELLENAIDAGASRIDLVVREAGKNLIQVTDNGSGMSETDARMCFERHATSKISKADDLFSIRTMGFRGEALASIAAVSQVELRTRRPADEHGTLVKIEGSTVVAHEICVCPAGTTIYVRNLFFNVPARRNFLKSTPVELRHIIDEFQRVALVHPHVAFTLTHNDKEVFRLATGSFKQRIVNLLGPTYNERLLSVSQEAAKIKIDGFVVKPEFSRKTRGDQFFFVNNRFIRHPYLHHAIENAFAELLPKDTFPGYFIHISIDPAEIDINIHPTKTEVNFLDTKLVYAILHAAVRKTLGMHQLSPRLDFESDHDHGIDFGEISRAGREVRPPTISIDPGFNPFRSSSQPAGNAQRLRPNENWRLFYQETHEKTVENAPQLAQQQKPAQEPAVRSAFLQLHGTYVISVVKSGLLIVNQHLASWRIRYESCLEHLKNGYGVSQQLLFPHTVQLNAREASLCESILPDLRTLGMDISKAGDRTFVVSGLPEGSEDQDAGALLEGLLEQLQQHLDQGAGDSKELLAAALSLRLAWPYGKTLSATEMAGLVDALFACSQPEVAPDGRKIFTLLGINQLNQYFE
ncbi:MAG: DNA mismatch repair endonuclease MutL [Bacteroidetes bacterium]|nr:DNA mismatch repair endonuclease MutL [Bacteroidota bacterium]